MEKYAGVLFIVCILVVLFLIIFAVDAHADYKRRVRYEKWIMEHGSDNEKMVLAIQMHARTLRRQMMWMN
jgi:hypothetical protein